MNNIIKKLWFENIDNADNKDKTYKELIWNSVSQNIKKINIKNVLIGVIIIFPTILSLLLLPLYLHATYAKIIQSFFINNLPASIKSSFVNVVVQIFTACFILGIALLLIYTELSYNKKIWIFTLRIIPFVILMYFVLESNKSVIPIILISKISKKCLLFFNYSWIMIISTVAFSLNSLIIKGYSIDDKFKKRLGKFFLSFVITFIISLVTILCICFSTNSIIAISILLAGLYILMATVLTISDICKLSIQNSIVSALTCIIFFPLAFWNTTTREFNQNMQYNLNFLFLIILAMCISNLIIAYLKYYSKNKKLHEQTLILIKSILTSTGVGGTIIFIVYSIIKGFFDVK